MTDTGQIPGEGLPGNAGVVEQQPGMPGPEAYTVLDPSAPRPARAAHTDDDLLLMPGAQGAWVDPQATLGGQHPSPVQPLGAAPVFQPAAAPVAAPAQAQAQAQTVHAEQPVGVPHPEQYGAEGVPVAPGAVPVATPYPVTGAPVEAAGSAGPAGPGLAPGPEGAEFVAPDAPEQAVAVAPSGDPAVMAPVGVVTAPGLVAPTDLGTPESAAPSIQQVAPAPATDIAPSAGAGAAESAPVPEQQGQEQPAQHIEGVPPEQQPGEPGEQAPAATDGPAAAPAVEEPVPGPQGEQPAPVFPPGSATPTPPPGRRPLHMGPPVPDHSTGVVRSLADRGPAGVAPHPLTAQHHPGPPTLGPEYLDVPRDEAPQTLPGPQLAEIPPQAGAPWDAVPPQTVTPMEPTAEAVAPAAPVEAEAAVETAATVVPDETPAAPAEPGEPAAPVAEPVGAETPAADDTGELAELAQIIETPETPDAPVAVEPVETARVVAAAGPDA
ncbi:5,6-dimethylbenzimidazole synthase, partial [Streptomyces sp. NPDC058953]